ncbi:MAG: hypothetical protein H6634_18390 [Anaerolineales bacterium]|nr:hypothetical protein [Anaerolineales bacterium]
MTNDIHDELQEQDVDIGTPPAARKWLVRYAWIAVISFLAIFLLSFSLRLLVPSWAPDEVGGLDGCVLTIQGSPAVGTVKVGNKTKKIPSDDGCFFFKSLQPGNHQVSIETANGVQMEQTVEIVSGEAVSLGLITVP